MGGRIKIDGIYDEKTLTLLEDNKVKDFSFDLRPKSFNFIQEYKIIEIISNRYRPWNNYYFHFEGEKDFVIQKFVKDFKQAILKTDNSKECIDNIYLEFSDKKELSFYDALNVPFLFHYSDGIRLDDIHRLNNLKGIILPYKYLEFIHNKGQFGDFIAQLLKILNSPTKRGPVELVLYMDWDDSIFPSLIDYVQFDLISLPINNKIETSYRNVDFDALESVLREFRRLSLA